MREYTVAFVSVPPRFEVELFGATMTRFEVKVRAKSRREAERLAQASVDRAEHDRTVAEWAEGRAP
jgi:hypothetical protein